MENNIHYAVLAGGCASAASLCGKLSGLQTFQDYLILRIAFFALMIAFNAGVWTLFVKALHQANSSLAATVISSATNYILSGVAGSLVFGEVTSLLWWSGMGFIIIGLLLVLSDQDNSTKDQSGAKRD